MSYYLQQIFWVNPLPGELLIDSKSFKIEDLEVYPLKMMDGFQLNTYPVIDKLKRPQSLTEWNLQQSDQCKYDTVKKTPDGWVQVGSKRPRSQEGPIPDL